MLDETSADGSITTSPATQADTGTATPVTPDSGTANPTGSGDAAQTAPSVDAGKQPANDDPRSLTSQTGPQNTETKTQAQVDWEKRYHDQAKGLGKIQHELGQLRKYREETQRQYDGIDPQTVAAWKQQKAQAEAAKLPKWHAKNPDRAMFQQQHAEHTRLLRAWHRAESPEAKAAFAAEMEQFPADLRQEFAALEQHKRSTVERLAEEMTGFNSLDEYMEAKFANKFQEQQARQQAEQKVNQWFDDPANKPYVEYTSPAMKEALEAGVPLPYVQRMAEMTYKLDILESRLAGSDQVAAAAQARSQAAKGNAAITRDAPTGSRKADPVAIAKERGVELNSTDYITILQELASKNLL
jgi:hypothetical protein